MNPTLTKLKEIARTRSTSTLDVSKHEQQDQMARAELAAPLIQAFRDVEHEFVRVEILKRIWPLDYEQKNDRVAGLLDRLIGPPRQPHGLRLMIPNGHLSFEVRVRPDGSPIYTCSIESLGQPPRAMEYVTSEPWMDYFYRTIADLVQL